jgi:ribosomal protein L19E
VTNPRKRKGDAAELEVQGILRDQLGYPARRALGAGRKDDMGDITGIPDTVVQVAAWADLDRAVREKLPELERQQATAAASFAGLFVRRRGGRFVVVLTVDQWCTLIREAQAA